MFSEFPGQSWAWRCFREWIPGLLQFHVADAVGQVEAESAFPSALAPCKGCRDSCGSGAREPRLMGLGDFSSPRLYPVALSLSA